MIITNKKGSYYLLAKGRLVLLLILLPLFLIAWLAVFVVDYFGHIIYTVFFSLLVIIPIHLVKKRYKEKQVKKKQSKLNWYFHK